MLLNHKKHTSPKGHEQAKFKRRMKYFAAWTALLLALAGLVSALAELTRILAKL